MNNFHMREGKVEFRWKRWRNKKRQEVSSCLMVLFSGAVLLGAGGVALAGPTGGQVTGGQGTITTPDGTTTNINQQSNVLNINWQDFSIGAGETVNFYQPGSTSVAINRVVGGVPSYLAGALNANGRVFILNSAGITFTGTSQVNVGALLATTAMTVNGDPTQAASYSGSGYGAVINQGSISVSNGGFAILAAPYVQNTGFIKADLGTIALAGTNQFTLDLSGTGLINFVVPAGAVEKIVSDGKAVGVDNSGTLQARSGQVLISASVASEVINAVVNLNGIVDADAFAPNGQGGSVLVTAAGDVNVGGQVTARGNGTGNGGQIVTKAGGADAIGALAYVSAAGGADGGEGGFIEVSAPHVAISGDIRAGAGGKILIDPANIKIVANSPLGLIGSNVGELWIESHLQAGSAESFVASVGNITVQALQGGVLAGGAGDLTLQAQQNIIFKGVNDTIVTGAGDVTLTAVTGSIGAANGVSGHAVNIVSGGLGVTQAGDIVLNAGKNIFLKKVTVTSVPGNSSDKHAEFHARAGNGINIAGLLDVEAAAFGSNVRANASAVLLAPHIMVTGPATVHANAGGTGTSHARAFALLAAANSFASTSGFQRATHAQDIHFGNAIDVEAAANGQNVSRITADADVILAGELITVNGMVTVDAFATGNHVGFMRARALMNAVGDEASNGTVAGGSSYRANGASKINFLSGIDVTANGHASSAGTVAVKARGTMDGNSITVGGPIVFNAQADGTHANHVRANAELFVQGSETSFSHAPSRNFTVSGGGKIHFANALTITATAAGSSATDVNAVAEGLLVAGYSANGLPVVGSIAVDGPAKVTAEALNKGNTDVIGNTLSSAHLVVGGEHLVTAAASGFSSNLAGNVDIKFKKSLQVQALTLGGQIGSAADAVEFTILAGRNITVGGNIAIDASATGHGTIGNLIDKANASAALTLDGGFHKGAVGSVGSLERLGANSIKLNGAVSVLASASGGDVTADASAVLLAQHINVIGPATVLANAEGSGPSHIYGLALLVAANGFSGPIGAGTGQRATHAQDIHFGNAIDVEADAKGHSASHAINAITDVILAGESITVGGEVTVKATATGSHAGLIKAGAFLNAVGDDASSLVSPANSSLFFRANGAKQINFLSGIDVTVNAQGSDVGRLVDKARGIMDGNSITVAGPIVFNAEANGTHANFVGANAELFVEGSETSHSNSLSRVFTQFGAGKIHFANALTITATAAGSSVGRLRAIAEGFLIAGYSTSGHPVVGAIQVDGPAQVTAEAINKGSTDVIGNALSSAHLVVGGEYSENRAASGFSSNLAGNVDIKFKKSLQVQALTLGGQIGNTAEAVEFITLAGRHIAVIGDITAQASATGHGTIGNLANDVIASAALIVDGGSHVVSVGSLRNLERLGASSITFNGNVNILAAATGGDLHSSIHASAGGFILAGGSGAGAANPANLPGMGGKITVVGKITMKATADNSGVYANSVDAVAVLDVAAALERASSSNNVTRIIFGSDDVINLKKGFDVEANARGGNAAVAADGTAVVHLEGMDVTVGGNAIVLGNATGHGFAFGPSNFAPDIEAIAALMVDGGSTLLIHSGSASNGNIHAASSILLTKAVDVEAHAIGNDVADIGAVAIAVFDATKVRIKGTKTVSSTVSSH